MPVVELSISYELIALAIEMPFNETLHESAVTRHALARLVRLWSHLTAKD